MVELRRAEREGRDRQQQKRKISELRQSNCVILLAEPFLQDIIMAGAFAVINSLA